MAEQLTGCPGCGVVLPETNGPVHRYMTSSAACWAGYGELLAAQYSSPERMEFHQLVVDAYAVQHPGGAAAVQVQSVGIHLMTLALFLEDGVDPAQGPQLHGLMLTRPAFGYLVPPTDAGDLAWNHVPVRGDHAVAREAAYDWGRSAWAAWADHHETVDVWLRDTGLR